MSRPKFMNDDVEEGYFKIEFGKRCNGSVKIDHEKTKTYLRKDEALALAEQAVDDGACDRTYVWRLVDFNGGNQFD